MRTEVKEAVLKVLREASRGFAVSTFRYTAWTGLKWWQRLLNWIAAGIGVPYTDPDNWSKITLKPLDRVAKTELIYEAMMELATESRCETCGGTDLEDDPSGYYCNATRCDGAPLLCRNCADATNLCSQCRVRIEEGVTMCESCFKKHLAGF